MCDRGKKEASWSLWRRSLVPLKKLNKKAINVADSHGGDSSVWIQDRCDWSLAEHVLNERNKSTSVMVDGTMRSEEEEEEHR